MILDEKPPVVICLVVKRCSTPRLWRKALSGSKWVSKNVRRKKSERKSLNRLAHAMNGNTPLQKAKAFDKNVARSAGFKTSTPEERKPDCGQKKDHSIESETLSRSIYSKLW